jgi:hypothetical protein
VVSRDLGQVPVTGRGACRIMAHGGCIAAYVGGIKTPQTSFFRLYFFAPLCSLGPPGVLFLAGGAMHNTEVEVCALVVRPINKASAPPLR